MVFRNRFRAAAGLRQFAAAVDVLNFGAPAHDSELPKIFILR
jgi:hypothetical protein